MSIPRRPGVHPNARGVARPRFGKPAQPARPIVQQRSAGPAQPTAAPRPRPAGVRAPRRRWSLNDFIERETQRSGAVITGFVIAIVAVANLLGPVQIWFEQQIRIASLTADVAQATAELSTAQENLSRWNDRAYIEAQARQRLMYVYPGDISYLVVNDVHAKPAKSDEVLSTVSTTSVNWVDAFLASYAVAATTGTGK